MKPLSRTLTYGTGVAVLMLALASCQAPLPPPDDAAAQLEASLRSGDFAQLPQTPESVAPELETAFAALQKAERSVELQSVVIDEETEESAGSDAPPTATATYHTTWQLEELGVGAREWDYTTEATFVYDSEQELWLADLQPEIAAPQLDADEVLSYQVEAGARGKIVGSNGEVIVEPRPVYVIGIDKTNLTEEEASASARSLAQRLEIDADEFATKVEGYGENAFVEATTLRQGGEFSPANVEDISGALVRESTLPLAQTQSFARTVVGHVGEPTAEQLEAATEAGTPLPQGVMVGQAGIQASQNETLAGDYGITVYAGADPILELNPAAGSDVVSSIHPQLQEAAEDVIANFSSHTALVAIRPSDGAVLASAVGPRGYTTPTATAHRYPPGSTFKLVTALGMLREGITPETDVSCPATTNVHGQPFKNFDGFPSQYVGMIPFKEAIAQSCNTVFANQWDVVTAPKLADAGLALGLNPEANTGLDVFMASIPEDSEYNLQASNLFGQGVIETSVLGMATVAASISAGETVTPQFVLDPALEETALPENPLTAEEGADLRSMMAGTVSHGTVPILQDVPGEPVLAKTGTAEFGTPNGVEAHTWVVAIHGDLAIAVFVEIGEYGSSTNGPIARDFLTSAYDILGTEETEES